MDFHFYLIAGPTGENCILLLKKIAYSATNVVWPKLYALIDRMKYCLLYYLLFPVVYFHSALMRWWWGWGKGRRGGESKYDNGMKYLTKLPPPPSTHTHTQQSQAHSTYHTHMYLHYTHMGLYVVCVHICCVWGVFHVCLLCVLCVLWYVHVLSYWEILMAEQITRHRVWILLLWVYNVCHYKHVNQLFLFE